MLVGLILASVALLVGSALVALGLLSWWYEPDWTEDPWAP